MDRAARIRTFGTDELQPASRRLSTGALAVDFVDGAIRGIYWNDVEVLRRIDYSVRDPQWGTYANRTISEAVETSADKVSYLRLFDVGDGLFDGRFSLRGAATGALQLSLRLVANVDTEVNRASFALLHPGVLCAGTPLRVTHTNGTIDNTAFPTLMSPSQLALDIAALRQTAGGVTADIAFTGEVFELEDQRNWTDASFKTYGRPLSLPVPYKVTKCSAVEQSLMIELSGRAAAATSVTDETRIVIGPANGHKLPEPMLALERGWEGRLPAGAPVLLRIDLTRHAWEEDLTSLVASATGAVDLETIVPDDIVGIDTTLGALAMKLERLRFAPRNLIALPAAYTQSYDPSGPWPPSAAPEQALHTARRHFPRANIGGGVLTNFSELNRYQGSARIGDFVTHGTTAIIHTADDVGVMQTTEMLPQIFASAGAIAPGKPLRLGLCAIAMRSNPYAASVAPNPSMVRVAMAQADPRQRGLFAASFMVGIVGATQASSVASLALAAPGGPFGLRDEDGVYPLWHTFARLLRLSGEDRLPVVVPAGLAAVACRTGGGNIELIIANLTDRLRRISLPQAGKVVVLDDLRPAADWLATASYSTTAIFDLSPYAVGFIHCDGASP